MKHLKRVLNDVNAIKELANRLSKCYAVSKFDKKGHSEAWTLAHALSDLEQSFRRILDVQLMRLSGEELNESEINDLLLEIGEELRHILYHIRDSEFYKYLEISK